MVGWSGGYVDEVMVVCRCGGGAAEVMDGRDDIGVVDVVVVAWWCCRGRQCVNSILVQVDNEEYGCALFANAVRGCMILLWLTESRSKYQRVFCVVDSTINLVALCPKSTFLKHNLQISGF
ncbi:hypothetical protein Tco_0322393 [Tanacetum coccineum]